MGLKSAHAKKLSQRVLRQGDGAVASPFSSARGDKPLAHDDTMQGFQGTRVRVPIEPKRFIEQVALGLIWPFGLPSAGRMDEVSVAVQQRAWDRTCKLECRGDNASRAGPGRKAGVWWAVGKP